MQEEQNLHSLAWLDVYGIDMQTAALAVDTTFNTGKTALDDRRQHMFS